MKFIELFAGIGGFRNGLERCMGTQSTDKESEQAEPKVQLRGERPSLEVEHGVLPTDNRGIGPVYRCVWANEIDKYACQIYRRNYGERDALLNTETSRLATGKETTKEVLQNSTNHQEQHGRYRTACGGGWDERSKLYEGDITKVNAEEIPDHDLLVGGFPCQAFSIAGKRGGFEDTRGTLFFEIARIAQEKRPRLLLLENVKGLLSHDKGRTFGAILTTLDEIGYDCQWQVLNSKNFGVPQNRERVFIIGHLRGTSRPEVFPIGENNQISDVKSGNELPKHLNTIRGNQAQYSNQNFVDYGVNIRRLTPTECERLQGFPDGWTEGGVSDTQRYKCLGNAVTTNVITEIGRRLI